MTYASEVLTDAPVGYWRLGGTGQPVDSSGHGYTGTLWGGPTPGAPGLLVGDTDTAVSFSGGSAALRMDALPVLASGRVTVEALVKPSAASLSGNAVIAQRANYGQGVSSGMYAYWLLLTDGQLHMGGNVGGSNAIDKTGGPVLVAGQTYHVAMTYDGATFRGYVNGAEVITAAAAGSLAGGSQTGFTVAKDGSVTYFPYTGVIDEVAVYDTALSSGRILAHYQAATGTTPPPAITGTLAGSLTPFTTTLAGTSTAPVATVTYASEVLTDAPVGYWRLGEASGTAALDSSGHGYTGTYTSGPTLGAAGLLTGDTDTAVSFDASQSYVQISAMPVITTNRVTVEAIVKPTAATMSKTVVVTQRANFNVGAAENTYAYWLVLSSGRLQAGGNIGGASKEFVNSQVMTANQTYHLVMTYDGTAVRGYINGTQVQSLPVTGTLASGSAIPLTIGKNEGGNLFPFGGIIDEVAVYDTALSPARVAAHYTAATTAPAPATITGTLAGSLRPVAATLAGTAAPPPATGALAGSLAPFSATLAGASAPPGTAATLAGSLAPFAVALAGTATPPPVTATLAGPLAPFAVALSGNSQTFGDKLTAVLPAFTAALAGQVAVIYATDTTYANDSYTYGGAAAVDYDTPVAPPPPGLVRRDVRRVHQALPTPTLVKGRPQ